MRWPCWLHVVGASLRRGRKLGRPFFDCQQIFPIGETYSVFFSLMGVCGWGWWGPASLSRCAPAMRCAMRRLARSLRCAHAPPGTIATRCIRPRYAAHVPTLRSACAQVTRCVRPRYVSRAPAYARGRGSRTHPPGGVERAYYFIATYGRPRLLA